MSARYRTRVLLGIFASIIVVIGFMDADPNGLSATDARCPQIESALAARGLPVAFFSHHAYVESKCIAAALNSNRATHDLSFGLLGINLYEPSARAWFVGQGFGYWNLFQPATNLNAAVALYNQCGEGAWVKTRRGYSCSPPKHKAVYR